MSLGSHLLSVPTAYGAFCPLFLLLLPQQLRATVQDQLGSLLCPVSMGDSHGTRICPSSNVRRPGLTDPVFCNQETCYNIRVPGLRCGMVASEHSGCKVLPFQVEMQAYSSHGEGTLRTEPHVPSRLQGRVGNCLLFLWVQPWLKAPLNGRTWPDLASSYLQKVEETI